VRHGYFARSSAEGCAAGGRQATADQGHQIRRQERLAEDGEIVFLTQRSSSCGRMVPVMTMGACAGRAQKLDAQLHAVSIREHVVEQYASGLCSSKARLASAALFGGDQVQPASASTARGSAAGRGCRRPEERWAAWPEPPRRRRAGRRYPAPRGFRQPQPARAPGGTWLVRPGWPAAA